MYGAVRGHLGLAVIPGMLFALPAHRMLRGVAAHLWAGLSGRPRGVWLTKQGVHVRLDRSVQLPWSDITAIRTATTSLGRGLGPRIAQNWVHVAVTDAEDYRLRQGRRGRIALRRQGDVRRPRVEPRAIQRRVGLRGLQSLPQEQFGPADRSCLESPCR